jgi:AcrR family transcriptional regulator
VSTELDPRAERTRTHALKVARQLLVSEGIGAITHLRISEVGGGARRTLYRHWPDVQHLLRDVLTVTEVPHARVTGDFRSDLIAHLCSFSKALERGHLAYIICAIGERAGIDDSFEPVRKQLTDVGCAPGIAILRSAIANQTLPKFFDVHAALAELEGPILYEAVMHRRATGRSAITRNVDRFLNANTLRQKKLKG